MKKIKQLLFSVFILFNGLLISSCANGYDEMLEDFNKENFSLEPTAPKETSINAEGFKPESMLERRYTFYVDYEASLTAPAGGAEYKWVVEKASSEDGSNAGGSSGAVVRETVCTKRTYNFMPGRDFKTNTETKLVLTVTDSSGTEYIDTALIIVINRN